MVCNECKKDIKDGARFCPWCGSKIWIQVEEEQKTADKTAVTDEKIVQTPPMQEQQYNIQNLSYEEPVSVKEWIITYLIMMVPVVNIVMLFVWAFGSKQKKSKSNYFKATLIMAGIIIALALLMVAFAFGSTNNQTSQNDLRDYVEDNNVPLNIYNDNGYYGYNYGNDDYYDDEDDYDYYDGYQNNGYDDGNDTATGLDNDYIFKYSDSEKLTDEMVKSLSKTDIRLAINEIYARHGRLFDDENIQEYFDEKEWYIGTVDAGDFDESVFNNIEKYNIRLLSKYR